MYLQKLRKEATNLIFLVEKREKRGEFRVHSIHDSSFFCRGREEQSLNLNKIKREIYSFRITLVTDSFGFNQF